MPVYLELRFGLNPSDDQLNPSSLLDLDGSVRTIFVVKLIFIKKRAHYRNFNALTSVHDLDRGKTHTLVIVYSHWALTTRKKKIIIKSRIMKSREIVHGAAKSQAAEGRRKKRGI